MQVVIFEKIKAKKKTNFLKLFYVYFSAANAICYSITSASIDGTILCSSSATTSSSIHCKKVFQTKKEKKTFFLKQFIYNLFKNRFLQDNQVSANCGARQKEQQQLCNYAGTKRTWENTTSTNSEMPEHKKMKVRQ